MPLDTGGTSASVINLHDWNDFSVVCKFIVIVVRLAFKPVLPRYRTVPIMLPLSGHEKRACTM